jgi:hypothetical protein
LRNAAYIDDPAVSFYDPTVFFDDPTVFFDVLDAGPMAPLRTAVTRRHASSIPIPLVPPLKPQERKRCLRDMYAPEGMSNPINADYSARTPSYADRRDALYTYRGAGLYANDGGGAIYIGVRLKEKDVEGWFADDLSTAQLLDNAEVKTGHAADWAVRRGGYRKCEGGEDIIIWLCTYEADERILAGKSFTLQLGVLTSLQKRLSITPISPRAHRASSALVSGPAAASITASFSLWRRSAGCAPWTAPSALSSHTSAKLAFVGKTCSCARNLALLTMHPQ